MPGVAEFLSWILIISPVPLHHHVPAPVLRPLLPALKRIAVAMEIACPGVEGWTQSAGLEASWCRDQYRAVRYCPSLVYAAELPPHAVCMELYRFAAARRCWLERVQITRLHLDLSDELAAARWAEAWWELATTATNPQGGARSRRQALAECWRMGLR